MTIKIIFLSIVAYLLGSINFSIVICKLKDVDIKKVGSGNAGATNTVRALGKKYGIMVFLCDFFKGVLSCLLAKIFGIGQFAAVIGIFAILGHNYPIYFGFKGGKGVSTTFGVIAAVNFWVALILGTFVLLLIFITKIVSLSVLITFTLLPIVMYLLCAPDEYINVYATLFYSVSVFFTHRQNIKRLINGTENKFKK